MDAFVEDGDVDAVDIVFAPSFVDDDAADDCGGLGCGGGACWLVFRGFYGVAWAYVEDAFGVAVKFRVGKQIGYVAEVHDGEVAFAVFFVDAGASADDLFEFDHRADIAIEHYEFAGLRVYPGGHELGGGGDYRVAGFGVYEVVKLYPTLGVVAGYLHYVFAVARHEVAIGVGEGGSHALGVVDVDAEDDGFGKAVGLVEKFGYSLGDGLGAFVYDQVFIVVFEVVNAVFDAGAVLVLGVVLWAPAFEVDIEADAQDFVGREKTILDALLERIGIDGVAEVIAAGDGAGFFGGGGEADMGGLVEVVQDCAPDAIGGSATTVAFVNHYQVEEAGAELAVGVCGLVVVGEALVERQIDFKGLIDLLVAD